MIKFIGFDEVNGIPEDKFAVLWERAKEMTLRREASAKQVTPCVKCGSDQVQLYDWYTPTLKMKFRTCKHKFTKELQ